MALRPGFRRYAISIQYHGSSFLGFSQQPDQENRILKDGKTDLRGYFTVESRLRQALTSLLSQSQRLRPKNDDNNDDNNNDYENIQVSSRTDRGVHAVKNTLHVDIRDSVTLRPESIHRGLNFYLGRPATDTLEQQNESSSTSTTTDDNDSSSSSSSNCSRKRVRNDTQYVRGGEWVRQSPVNHEIRILAVHEAPRFMYNPLGHLYGEPCWVDWNARYSATERTYAYRILHSLSCEPDWAAPFEWDRSWRVLTPTTTSTDPKSSLNVTAMRTAAAFLVGTHDFTSFRASRCQRHSPIMTLSDIQIFTTDYHHHVPESFLFSHTDNSNRPDAEWLGLGSSSNRSSSCQLVTILYKGDSFLYRQVRNMTGCLLHVGRGKLQPTDVQDLLQARERRQTPSTAPAHGLFLINVRHEGIQL